MEKGKGNTNAPSWPDKLAPKKKTPAPSAPHTLHPHPLEAVAALPAPSSTREAAMRQTIMHMLSGIDADTPQQRTSNRRSTCLNTIKKCNVRKGIMDSICDKH
jgi:hypothetical protein